MAVAQRASTFTIDSSTSATTVPFVTPSGSSNIVAGDIWILGAGFRAGSGVSITGVPGSFNLIQRLDQGAGSTVITIVAYWYLALGTETASSTLGTITLGTAAKHVTITYAYSGVNTTNPISGSVVTGTGTTAATTGTLAACPSTGAVIALGGTQGGSTTPVPSGSTSGAMSNAVGSNTSGGSAATNVGCAARNIIGSAVSQTYTESPGNTTAALMAFILAASAFQPRNPAIDLIDPAFM